MTISQSPNIVYWLEETLYLNITNNCTNDCYFCLRKFKTGVGGFNLKLDHEPSSDEIVKALQRMLSQKRWKEVVFCGYGEPTTRLDTLLEVARWLRKSFQKPIRVNTNGHALLLYPERDVANELKEAGICKLSVSLNAHDETVYNDACRPHLGNAFESILEFVKRARRTGLEVEVTAVAIPEVEISKVEKLASELKVKFRVRPYRACVW